MKTKIISCSAVLFSLLPLFIHADDTEIYTRIEERIPPNVIFILDTSGNMSSSNDGSANPPAGESRLELIQKATIETLNNTENLNISLMNFNESSGDNGGFVNYPMTPVEEARVDFAAHITATKSGGGTPLTETIDEALRYLRGDEVKYGKNDTQYFSAAEAHSGENYISPISHQCQQNHIVVFSGGVPSADTASNTDIQGWYASIPDENKIPELSTSCTSSGGCIEELVFYGNQEDLSSTYEGKQNATFHAIGGFVKGNSEHVMEEIAEYGSWAAPGKPSNGSIKEGKGVYESAYNYEELKLALEKIFSNIVKVSSTFTAPAVSVNAFNNLEHLDQLYYSVFKPNDNVSWTGNLKRYRLAGDGTVVDKNAVPAVDSETGFFLTSSHSYWTLGDEPDGNEVSQGGAASRFTTERKIVSNLTTNKSLFATGNLIHEDNSNITSILLGVPTYTPDQVTTLLQWARGIDVNDDDKDGSKIDARIFMEDPLHSQPVVINYGKDSVTKTFDSTVFIATNSGYLHAISTNEDNPKEHFAFVPSTLLDNFDPYSSGISLQEKVYGIDGPISYWHKDTNRNGVILDNSSNIETGEHIYLYAGMRRGDHSYFALDVSDRDDPKFLWKIDNLTSGFSKLGQTWSKMTPAVIKWQGVKTKVLFFGGGYDPAEDIKPIRIPSIMGNAIYMVDATTGELLWNSSNLGSDLNLIEMTSSIVANIVAVDSTLDGYTNLLYTADVGGRVWRLDLDNSATTAWAFAQGGVIADFNGGFINNNIRFFNTPDVAYTRYGGFSPDGQFQISIGSGYRAHPLDTQVTDRFYIINDTHVSTVPTNYTDYSEADLANINNFSSASESQQQAGSYYVFSSTGEKVLSSSVTVADNILFTTYRPVLDPIALTSCDANTGDTRLYQVKPIAPQSSDDSPLERDWGFTELAQGGIPPNPVVLFPPSDSPTEGDGDECPAGEVCPPPCEGEECESSCEQLTSITAIGAETVNSNITRCDQLTKKYWLIN